MSVDDSVRVYFVTTVIWTERTDPLLVDIARPQCQPGIGKFITHNLYQENSPLIISQYGEQVESVLSISLCNVPRLTECFQSTNILDGWFGEIKAGKY